MPRNNPKHILEISLTKIWRKEQDIVLHVEFLFKKKKEEPRLWLTPVIPVTQKAEIRRTVVQSKPGK
jgi:hypothetical protein